MNGVLLGWDPETRTRVIKVCGWGFLGGQGPKSSMNVVSSPRGIEYTLHQTCVSDHVQMCLCVFTSLRSCSDVLVFTSHRSCSDVLMCVHVSQIMFTCAHVCSRLSDHVHMCSCVFTCARVCSRLADASSNVRRPFLHDVYLFLNLAGPHLGGH